MKKLNFLILGLFVYWLFLPQPVLAAGDFSADYDVQYAVAPSGNTIVTQNVTLTNQQSNFYPKQYSIIIDSLNIKNVIAYDQQGMINPSIKQADAKTTIILNFNEQVVGQGKKLKFNLRFENEDIAKKVGRIWEVNVPGITPDPDLASYYVSLQVPSNFGPNAYLVPQPAAGTRWSREQMTRGGISAAYGSEQVFDLTLNYYLENQSLTTRTGEIALPPDTGFQQTELIEITPQPVTIYRDPDGNWLAKFQLAAGEKLNIQANLLVTTYINPRANWKDKLDNKSKLLTPDIYWETTDPAIIDLASRLTSPRAIYEYVVKTLNYDYNRVLQNPQRKGAVQTLAFPKNSICMEFTDLFVTVARAAAIPAREVVGFAYTTNPKLRPLSVNSDILHAWPEYYNPEGELWIPIDPTWANTTGGVNYFDKLDFNHIAFAIHGISSKLPYAAGSYRRPGTTAPQIAVKFADEGRAKTRTAGEQMQATFDFPAEISAGRTTTGTVTLKNNDTKTISLVTVVITAAPFSYQATKAIENLPPQGTLNLPITINPKNIFTNSAGRISVSVNDQVFHHQFRVRPVYWLIIPVGGTVLLITAFLTLATFKHKIWKKSAKR